MRALVTLLALAIAAAAPGQQVVEGFDDPATDQRYRELIESIRCMKCQNQSIADSPIDVAADLRREVRELIGEGRSDSEIRAYLAARYGDFVNYRPPVKPSTWLLWAGPGLLLVGGAVVFARIVRKRMNQPLDEDLA